MPPHVRRRVRAGRPGENIPAWLVFDQQYRDRYIFAGLNPGQRIPRKWLESGVIVAADTLEERAAKTGLPAEEPTATGDGNLVAAGGGDGSVVTVTGDLNVARALFGDGNIVTVTGVGNDAGAGDGDGNTAMVIGKRQRCDGGRRRPQHRHGDRE